MVKKNTSRIAVLALFVVIMVFVALGFIILHSHWANDRTVTQAVASIDQNALHYIHPNTTVHISKKIQSQLVRAYFKQYFLPWNTKVINHSLTPAKIFENYQIQEFRKNTGYGQNRQLHTKQWIKDIVGNMNMTKLFKLPQKAISIRDTNIRVLPTDDPSFDNWEKAGEGYPFDYIQNTRIYANTPIAILSQTKDRLWSLIETASYIGWVRSNSIALVDDNFIRQWKKPKYITVTQNNISASNRNFSVLTRMNVLYPLLRTTDHSYHVLVTSIVNGKGHIEVVSLNKNIAAVFPMAITLTHIAMLINHMIDDVYGWGSLNGHNDCSSTLVDLMNPFGIYLAPNTKDQMESVKWMSIANLNNKQKEKFIIKHGIPFITWLYQPGHILLYIGIKNNHPYVLQDVWGLRTKNLLGQSGRAVIGKTVITPLNFGSQYMNVPFISLDNLQKIAILTEQPDKKLEKNQLLWYHPIDIQS